MKKTILYAAILFLCIIMGLGFKKQQPFDVAKLSANVIECLPADSYEEDAILFAPDPKERMLIRKDITTLTPTELADFRKAIGMMKKDTISFFYKNSSGIKKQNTMTIWDFQAAMHGEKNKSEPKLNKDFRQCMHKDEFFLAWHRMYIYFFERVLHKYMPKGSKLGLPYWDYQTCSTIPYSCKVRTVNTAPNPLYDDTRDKSLGNENNKGFLPGYKNGTFVNSKIFKAIEAALDTTEFYSFQNTLEGPHGNIHYAVGGNLAENYAALDPLFWLNHSNVDRLWEKWLALEDTRCNPASKTDNNWWARSFYFYNEKKERIKIKASQIVDIVNDLHYKYDNVTSVSTNTNSCKPLNASIYAVLTNTDAEGRYSVKNATINNNYGNEFDFATGANSISMNASFAFMPNTAPANLESNFFNNNFYLEFENITVKTMPAGIIEMYISDKKEIGFSPSDESFVGLFDLFSALSVTDASQGDGHAMNEGHDGVYRININDAIKKVFKNITGSLSKSGIKVPNLSGSTIKASFENLKNVRIHFIIRGNVLNGEEVKKNVNITIGKLSLAAYKK
jgi:Common central domain of tyrosinase/Polyphenol oxidase middle domain